MSHSQRRVQQSGRPSGLAYGQPPPIQIPFVAPKLWTMQIPKLPTEEPFIPDLHGPNGTEPEDKLSADMIEHGYRDPPLMNEFGNLRHFLKYRLADVADIRTRVGNEIDVLHWCIQARTKPTTVGDAYRPPATSGTMNEPQKKDWMKAFVNFDLRVNTLETVPHFKIEALIKHLYEFDVPFPKALWLIKAIFRDTRSMQQKDDFAQGMTDAIRGLTQILYAPSPHSPPNSYSSYSNQHGTTRGTSQHASSHSSTQTASTRASVTVKQEPQLSASNSALTSSTAITFPKPPTSTASHTPEQQYAKTNLLYVIKLLGWTYRDGFIPLDIITGGLANDFSNCNDSIACVYLSVIFQFLPDIIINYPALEKLKIILQHLSDRFSSKPAKEIGTPGPETKLFSLYCSTLKVLVSYLPDFLDTQSLESLRRYMVNSYTVNINGAFHSPTTTSPGGHVLTPYGSNAMASSSASSLHTPKHTSWPSGGINSINPYILTPTQLSALHVLYQNINANRASIMTDSSCYDHICNLLAMNSQERAISSDTTLPGSISSRVSDTWHAMGALNALDSFTRHMDMDEVFNCLFLRNNNPSTSGTPSSTNPIVTTPGSAATSSGLKLGPLNTGSSLPSHSAASTPDVSGRETPAWADPSSIICGETLEKTIEMICSWAISPFRSGVHRIFVASSLIRRFLAYHPQFIDTVYDLLIDFMDHPPSYSQHDRIVAYPILSSSSDINNGLTSSETEGEKQSNGMDIDGEKQNQSKEANQETVYHLSMLIGELIRNKAFSHDKYLRRLISRGLLQHNNSVCTSTASKHCAYLLNIPLFGDCKHDRVQRNLTIHRYLPEANERKQLDRGIALVNQSLLRLAPAFLEPELGATYSFGSTAGQSSLATDVSQSTIPMPFSGNNDAHLSSQPSNASDTAADAKTTIPSRAESENQLSTFLDTSSVFIRNSVGQYALSGVKCLISIHYGGDPPETRPVGMDPGLTLSQIDGDQIQLIQKLCVLLERISDFRSMVELARWLLDRSLYWNMGDDVLSKCVVPLCKAYEHVLLALDFPMASFLERFLIRSQRWRGYPYNSPNAFLLKFVAKHSPRLKRIAAWANDKTLSLNDIRRHLNQKLEITNRQTLNVANSGKTDPQAALGTAFLSQIEFESSSLLLQRTPSTSSHQPIVITSPAVALTLLEGCTEKWLMRVLELKETNPEMEIFAAASQVERVCGTCLSERSLSHALSQTFASLQPSTARTLLKSLITGNTLRSLLTSHPGCEVFLSKWFDSLCTCLYLSGELILSLVTKILNFVVSDFQTLDAAYISFVLRLMATLAHFSFQPRDQHIPNGSPNRWLHTLGRPIKKKSLQCFVSLCSLIINQANTKGEQPAYLTLLHPNSKHSKETESLLWFLGESLLNLPSEELSAIFKSLGDPITAFHVCSIIFKTHEMSLLMTKLCPRDYLPSYLSHLLPSSKESASSMASLQESPLNLCDSSVVETAVKTILGNTHLWTVRFTSLQLQLLLDAANEIEIQGQTAQTNAMEETLANSPHPPRLSMHRINEVFSATLMQKLSVMTLWLDGENNAACLRGVGPSATGNCSSSNSGNTDAIMSLMRRLGVNVRLDLLSYIFRLLDPSKSSYRDHLMTALLGPDFNLTQLLANSPVLSPSKVDRRLVELLLSTIACCLDSQLSFPIDQVLEPHISYIDTYVLPHLNDFTKWREIRTQLYIRLSLIRWVLPSDPDAQIMGASSAGGSATTASTKAGGNNSILDKLTIFLLRLLAAPVLQENILDGKDLWTLALHSFASLKNHQKQAATRRAIAELYPTLTMPAHLRVRLEPVLQSAARKDRAIYLNNSSRLILPKGLDATRQLEEQPEPALLNSFGARKIPSRQLTYANYLLSSVKQGSVRLDAPSARQKRPGEYDHIGRPGPPQPR